MIAKPVDDSALGASVPLLDREAEVGRLEEAIAAAGAGSGEVLLVEGEAGIGKTGLLQWARERACGAGMRLLEAVGGPLEREFPFGVVRQLFEGCLARMAAQERRAMLAGAAAGAAAVVGVDSPAGAASGLDLARVLHGLYWLCSNMAEAGPLAVAVDDAHWADSESLRWLSYMTNRAADLPLLLVLAVRSGEETADPASLGAITSAPATTVLRPDALSEAASRRIVRGMLGEGAADAFCRACHAVSSGNPFYLRELVAETRRQEIPPEAEQADRVATLGPRAISSAILVRLARLPKPAAAVAQAVTILGRDVEVRHAAALAGVPIHDADRAADTLAAAGILDPERPLNFIHPVVAAAIHADMPAGKRSAAHERAADLLAAEGADPGVVASHLLLVEPADDPTARERLELAANEALAHGAPAAAARFLQRALAETPDPQARAALLVELGRAGLAAGDPSALGHLDEALRRARDPDLLVEATLLAGTALGFAARFGEADDVAKQTLERLSADPDDPRVLSLEALRVQMTAFDSRYAAGVAERLPGLIEQASRAGATGRSILMVGAQGAAIGVDRCDEVATLVARSTAAEPAISEETADSVAAGQAVCALAFVDELDRAEDLLGALFADAQRRHSVLTYVTVLVWRGWVALRRGRVPEGLADEHAALDLSRQHGLLFPLPWAQAFLAAALLEAGRDVEAEAMADAMPLDAVRIEALQGMALGVRGHVRLARGRREEGIADLTRAGELHEAIGHINPNATHWRSRLAVELGRESPAAAPLVEAELALARRAGHPRGIGVALRAQGLLAGGQEGIHLLRESVRVLEESPARLEHGRALIGLGAELRRQGRRADAREPLRHALDIADRLGAERMAEEARAELAAAGGRPRRRRLRGVESLTPTEVRVAVMAAGGLRNKDIAQALFVSGKTVEMHLGNAYRKLDIHTRRELAAALEARAAGGSGSGEGEVVEHQPRSAPGGPVEEQRDVGDGRGRSQRLDLE